MAEFEREPEEQANIPALTPSWWERIWLTPGERRVRAGWRLLLFLVLLLLLQFVMLLPFARMLIYGSRGTTGWLLYSGCMLVATTLAVWLARVYLDRRTFVSLGLRLQRRTVPDLLFGFLLGGLLMGGIFLLFLALGWARVHGVAWHALPIGTVIAQTMLALLGVGVLVGWYEELFLRGYVLQNLAEGLSLPWAVVLSSIIFGLLHMANPHAGWQAVLGVSLAGFFLAYGWLRTRQLWISIGLHAGWNFFQTVVFGFPVSGIDGLFHLTRLTVSGPPRITGGAFGPEAGLIALPAMLLGIGLIELWVRATRRRSC